MRSLVLEEMAAAGVRMCVWIYVAIKDNVVVVKFLLYCIFDVKLKFCDFADFWTYLFLVSLALVHRDMHSDVGEYFSY